VIFNNKNIKNWNEVKSMGMKSFILKYGIMRWGIPTGISYSVLMLLFNSNIHSIRSFIIYVVINLLIFSLLGGSLFGFVMWKLSEKKL
jgi:ABC-type multidrug transport system permease subunit